MGNSHRLHIALYNSLPRPTCRLERGSIGAVRDHGVAVPECRASRSRPRRNDLCSGTVQRTKTPYKPNDLLRLQPTESDE